MLPLEDPLWDEMEGGYRILYNPISALKKLEGATDAQTQSDIYSDLWADLHHQGDLGLCSYACVPHLVRIALVNPPKTFDFFALVAIIEIERHRSDNPPLPNFLCESYHRAMSLVPLVIAEASPEVWDDTTIGAAAAALAAAKGNYVLGRAYLELNNELAMDFLKEETGWTP